MEEIKVWKLVKSDNGQHIAVAIDATDKTTTEKILEEILTTSPTLLMENLHIIARQAETQGGPLDLLGVDDQGRLVVFELKRGTLTRDAVAQAIDYASYVASLTDDQLTNFVNLNSGKYGTAKIDDFASWYQGKFPKTLSDIGKPRIALVGIGADEATKRMVSFLSQSDLEISIITFHAFLEGGQIYLAKQVEEKPRTNESSGGGTKAGNLAELQSTLDSMGIRAAYDRMANSVCAALGTGTYQWPYTNGFTFSRPGPSSTGGRTLLAYLALYVDKAHPGKTQVYLQPRAVEAAGQLRIEQIAIDMGGTATKTAGGTIWFRVEVNQQGQDSLISQLATAIIEGSQPPKESV